MPDEEARLLEVLRKALQHYENKEFEPAKILCAEVLAQAPSRADALTLMGILHRKEDDFDRAEHYYLEALRFAPDYADALNNLGNLARERGRLPEALGYYQRAINLRPAWAEGYDHLGSVLHSMNRVPDALVAFEKAIELRPDYADAHWDRSLALLAAGRYPEGWDEYAWRWQRRQPIPREFKQPTWDGKADLHGLRILIYGEQGYGDVLQFLRFVPKIKALGATVILEVYDIVAPLVPAALGADRVVVTGTPLPTFDVQVALLDLPRLFRISSDDLDGRPYLAVPADRRAVWAEKIRGKGLKVGVAWAGNPNVKNDRWRSPRLAPLLPLFDVPGVTWYALQKGDGRRDLEGIGPLSNLVDLGDQLRDFADTAAVIEQLDLVISTDTSVVHLAGALGKPVWVLLHHSLDWRWTGGAAKAWYPSVTLFQQARLGEWDEVVGRVLVQLEQQAVRGKSEVAAGVRPALHAACPLCGETQFTTRGTYACSRQDATRPAAPLTTTWMRCNRCEHEFAQGDVATDRRMAVTQKLPRLREVDLDAQRLAWAPVVELVRGCLGHQAAKSCRWLDVGCGSGALVAVADEFGFEAVGLDQQADAVSGLRELGYTAIEGDLFLHASAQPYSVVSLTNVLELQAFPGEVLRYLAGLMDADGLLLISAPNSASATWRALEARGQNPYRADPACMHAFNRERLERLLSTHGFDAVHYSVNRRFKAGMDVLARRRNGAKL